MNTPDNDAIAKAEKVARLKAAAADVRRKEALADKADMERQAAKERHERARKAAEGTSTATAPIQAPRRRKYTEAVGQRICEALAMGATLREAAAAEDVAPSAVLKWRDKHKEFGERYAQAREFGYMLKADRLDELVQEAHRAALDPEFGSARIAACRLEVDTVKWVLSKMLPKVYGDRQAVEVSGPEGKDLFPQHTREAVAEFAALVANVRAKVDGCTDGLECNYADRQDSE